jgi:hypothetical protein
LPALASRLPKQTKTIGAVGERPGKMFGVDRKGEIKKS